MRRPWLLVVLCALPLLAQVSAKPTPRKSAMDGAQDRSQDPVQGGGATLFAYFREPGSQGVYFALSDDGFHYTELNDGKPWMVPGQPGEIMRDVFVTRNPDGHGFRAVWTWGWKGHSLGYAESPDLLHWGPQREIPIMAAFPTVRNTWAPEMSWDAARGEWLVYWSSSFTASPPPGVPAGLRIWAARTRDFVSFSTPAVFFDRGFPAIDATMLHDDGKWYLLLKDQTTDPLRYSVRWTSGPSPEGPWGELSGPVTSSWSEGPSALRLGREVVVFYDHYRPPLARYGGVATTDWVHWRSVDAQMQFPQASKHGSFLHVTAAEAAALRTRHDGGTLAPPCSSTGADDPQPCHPSP